MPRPQIWVLAGGNGAGKTTFYEQFLQPLSVVFVNADRIAGQLYADSSTDLSYEAAAIAARIRDQLMRDRQSFCFETVFSHPSKIDFIARAKAAGYEIVLVFIHLDHVALNKARVIQRVSTGGHDVPKGKIASRIPRTLKHIKTALPLCDRVELIDNSSYAKPMQRVASILNGQITSQQKPLPEWAATLLEQET
jgi:predicted ABC-type ATPase